MKGMPSSANSFAWESATLLRCRLAQRLAVPQLIDGVRETWLAIDAALDNVLRNASEIEARLPCHVGLNSKKSSNRPASRKARRIGRRRSEAEEFLFCAPETQIHAPIRASAMVPGDAHAKVTEFRRFADNSPEPAL